jgi:4-amino-4-deoxy-L-arabinose transferase-like glycosyltransferase
MTNLSSTESLHFKEILLGNLFQKELLILAAIVIAAAIARFWSINNVGLGGDESVYAGQALILAGHEEMERFFVLVSRGSSNFLVHQGLQALSFVVAGFSDLSTRFASSLTSTLTVVPVFLLGRELYGKWTGITAALLFAINGYSIAIGRLALLDSTMVFFFTLSMFFLAKWLRQNEKRPLWIYLFAVSTALAVMTKTVAFLIIPIAIFALVSSRQIRKISLRTAGIAVLVFFATLIPAIYQLISYYDIYKEFFFQGASRVINVPATYYFDKLALNAGAAFLVVMFLGIAVALFYRKKEDLFCLLWLGIVFAFLQAQPIKGWNYLLPIIPVATILVARAFVFLISLFKPVLLPQGLFSSSSSSSTKTSAPVTNNNNDSGSVSVKKMVAGILIAWIFIISSFYQVFTSMNNIIDERPFAGVREAAFWLRDNAPGEGVMILSQGSAQYVLSLYGNIDAYPFGRYQLNTILPGGTVIRGPPDPDPLIQNGTVTYFVYYVSPSINDAGDDPIHDPGTPSAKKFVQFIHKYQSNVRHIIYDEYVGLDGKHIKKARAFIYEVGKRIPEPGIDSVNFDSEASSLHVEGFGFLSNAYVQIYFHNRLLESIPTDEIGSFTAQLNIPESVLCEGKIYIFDDQGNSLIVPVEQCTGY